MSGWRIGVVLAVVMPLAAGGVVASATEEDLSHAVHNSPGNTAVAFPLAQGVAHIGGDNSSTGGHVVVEGERLYVGGIRAWDAHL